MRKWSPTGFPIWCTYYGGSGQDGGGIPGHDSLGNIYFIGGTQSSSGIATPGSFIDTYSPSAGTNTFVAKLNTNGIRIWASYLNFEIYTMKIDHAANIIISGFAQVNGLATTGAHQTNLAGGTDDFLMKLNSNGIRLWATYYGGSDEELNSASIDVDNNNNIYLCGLTQSSNNIASLGAFQTVYGGGGGDVFFAKFNSAGVRQWGTYYGGNSNEDLTSNIAVDPFGNIYVTGKGATANFFATPGAFQMNLGGIDQDCFLSKFTGSGQRIWSTYFGGSKEDQLMSLTTDKQGNAIFSGYTLSSDIIATPGAFQDTFGGVSINSNSYDGFIEKFSPIGTRLWGTYLGSGDADDYISGITSGNNNEVIFTAIVTRPGIASSGAYCTTLSPNTSDGYLASFDSTGKLTTPVPELSGSSASIIQVYPNPAKDLVQVSLPSLAQGTVTISDAMGKVVKSVVVKSQEMTIDIKDLPAGVYLLQYDDGEVCETVKVVKE